MPLACFVGSLSQRLFSQNHVFQIAMGNREIFRLMDVDV